MNFFDCELLVDSGLTIGCENLTTRDPMSTLMGGWIIYLR
jgi:hypothetical protein